MRESSKLLMLAVTGTRRCWGRAHYLHRLHHAGHALLGQHVREKAEDLVVVPGDLAADALAQLVVQLGPDACHRRAVLSLAGEDGCRDVHAGRRPRHHAGTPLPQVALEEQGA